MIPRIIVSALAIALLIVVLVVVLSFPVQRAAPVPKVQPEMPTRSLVVGGLVVHAFVADTETLREKGLSGREGLAPNEGMLFVFGEDGRYSFWMKDMQFSIDILWLTSEGKVVYIQHNLSPETYPATYRSPTPARYVLELPAGFAQSHGIHVGDTVSP